MLMLLLLPSLLTQPSAAAASADLFDVTAAADVLATALAFMAPRTLDPIPVSRLTLWGLNGLATLDAGLVVTAAGGRITLQAGGRAIISLAIPPEDDTSAWGHAAADIAQAAWTASASVRQAGQQAVITGFFDELFNHLDPYSRYIPPDDARGDLARRDGAAGIGIELGGPPGNVRVTAVQPNQPAWVAGLRPAARILAVDGQSTAGQDADTVSDWLAGADGSDVELVIADARGRRRTLSITRALITPETVYADRRGGVLTLRITAFSRDTDARVEEELDAAMTDGPRLHGVILDMRGNRGGLLRQAVLVADALQGGGVVTVTQGRDPEASVIWRSGPDDMTRGLPLVVLVDGRTASAAEILAAALQDQGRAVVVGSATLGKGLVQTIAPLPDGGELFITWSRVITPAGYPLQGLGVLPQICTSQGQGLIDRQMAALAHGELLTGPTLQRHDNARAPVPLSQILDIRATCPAAEGRDADLVVARKLLSDPAQYAAARLSIALPAP
jgi:carboxyl-terminal processing protease